jgi:2-methylfumaryl-CoA isomerase
MDRQDAASQGKESGRAAALRYDSDTCEFTQIDCALSHHDKLAEFLTGEFFVGSYRPLKGAAMYKILSDMRVIEGSSFVAAPLGGMYLAQLGAEVIRFDMIGGGPDYRRWPVSARHDSFYWEGLNKGKKSVAIDLGSSEGRELAVRIATSPDPRGRVFLTNYPSNGFLAHDKLSSLCPDLITIRVTGTADGSPALDYTVNSAVGIPYLTGPPSLKSEPVNHVLPAWDLLTGAYAAFSVLAAERHRQRTGEGQEVRVPLADIAASSVANLGQFAEFLEFGRERPRLGNDVFGAFGRDFVTSDKKRIMVMALTPRHWSGLVRVLGIEVAVAQTEARLGISFANDEGLRFMHRDVLNPLVQAAIETRTYDDLAPAFSAQGVCWGPYQTIGEAIADPTLVRDNPLFADVQQPSGLTYPVPGAPATFCQSSRGNPVRAPFLGEHTEEVLSDLLGMGAGEIAGLHDRGIVATAAASD